MQVYPSIIAQIRTKIANQLTIDKTDTKLSSSIAIHFGKERIISTASVKFHICLNPSTFLLPHGFPLVLLTRCGLHQNVLVPFRIPARLLCNINELHTRSYCVQSSHRRWLQCHRKNILHIEHLQLQWSQSDSAQNINTPRKRKRSSHPSADSATVNTPLSPTLESATPVSDGEEISPSIADAVTFPVFSLKGRKPSIWW